MLEIKTTDCDNEVVLIDVIGEITFENSDELRDTIDRITESKNNLVINFLGL